MTLRALSFLLPLAALAVPAAAAQASTTGDRERARFEPCAPGPRVTCVVDGDTFWYRGEKIRIADINAPELGRPGCPTEARLARQATARLAELLNQGPFTLAATGRATDFYGRSLYVVERRGRSLGAALEDEGLAERWKGRRGDWCRRT